MDMSVIVELFKGRLIPVAPLPWPVSPRPLQHSGCIKLRHEKPCFQYRRPASNLRPSTRGSSCCCGGVVAVVAAAVVVVVPEG